MSNNKKSPVRLVRFEDVNFQSRHENPDQAKLGELSGESDGSELGVGYAKLTNADIDWTIKYDEVLTVVEGSVLIETPEGKFELQPKDSIWLPKGTPLKYRAENCLLLYSIHPSNWASLEDGL